MRADILVLCPSLGRKTLALLKLFILNNFNNNFKVIYIELILKFAREVNAVLK